MWNKQNEETGEGGDAYKQPGLAASGWGFATGSPMRVLPSWWLQCGQAHWQQRSLDTMLLGVGGSVGAIVEAACPCLRWGVTLPAAANGKCTVWNR